MRVLLLSCCALIACTPPIPPPGPEAEPTEVAPTPTEPSTMTLAVREVSQPGWSGRVVAVSFSNGRDRHLRVLPTERPRPLQEIAARANPPQPFAAIDGGFYDTDNRPMGLVRAGGQDHHAVGDRGGSGILYVRDGVPRIVHRDAYRPASNITEALQSIDRLVNGGSSVVGAAASSRRAARSAVAIDGAGGFHLVVAFDERAVETETDARIVMGADATRTGPTIAQWAELLASGPDEGGVGAREALGLDGGFSTALVVKSEARALSIVPYNATINAVLVTVNDG